MAVKCSIEALVVAGIFLLLVASVLLVPFWHEFPIVAFSASSLSLQEYSVKAYNNEEQCFKLNFHVPENLLVETATLRVFTENTPLFFEQFSLPSKEFVKTVCFDSEALNAGDNRVEVLALGNSLFFHVQKLDGQRPLSKEMSVTGIVLDSDIIGFEVNNFDTSFYVPVEIYVNNVLDHRVYPSEEHQLFDERIEMKEGLNNVAISFNGKTISREFEKKSLPQIPFFLGLALFTLAVFVFSCLIFSKYNPIEKFALGITFVFVLLIALVFVLNYLGSLNFYSVAGSFAVITFILLILFRKNFSKTIVNLKLNNLSPLLIIAIALFFIVPVAFHMFSFTHITYWNQFYERQSALIVESGSIPVWDELAYLGRSYSFAPGYFTLEAGLSWVTGLSGTELFSVLLLCSNILLFFAVFYFGDALKLSQKKMALLAFFVAMSGFLISAMSYSPRHVFSFAFFLIALSFILKHNRPAVAGLLLAVMAFIQFPLLIFFPFFYLIVARKIEMKRLLKTMLFAFFLTLLFMLPNLLLYGLPFQASAEDWGYLINYSLYYWFIDIVALLVFFVLFSLTDVFRKKAGKDVYSRKLFLGFLLGTFIQMVIIYRWNILTTTTLALLIVVLLPEKELVKGFSERILSILALVAFGFLLLGMSYLNVHEIVTTPVSFVAENTSTNSKILSDPMFGHNISSVAERPVLADLRVEYADEEKLSDAYLFLETKDYSVLEKYSIDYTFNQVDYIHKQAIGGQPKYGIIEFYPMDKIYSNGFIFVHRVPKSMKGNN